MFDEKTILTRLQNGEDIQKIANEMTAVINTANKIYTDQKAAEEAAKAAAAKAEVQKKEELQEILNLFLDWIETYYNTEVKENIAADQVIELIDSVQEYIKVLKDFEFAFGGKKPVQKKVKIDKTTDEVLDSFLKQMGW